MATLAVAKNILSVTGKLPPDLRELLVQGDKMAEKAGGTTLTRPAIVSIILMWMYVDQDSIKGWQKKGWNLSGI